MTTPIVLLHGMRVSSSMWGPLAAELERSGCRVHAPDLPGHGSHTAATFDHDLAVRDTLDAIGAESRALLVGHSLGGFVAMAAAARQPDKVAGVVAIGASSSPTGIGLTLYRAYAAALGSRPELGARFTTAVARRYLSPPVADAWVAGGYRNESAPSVVSEMARLDPLTDLAGYPGPVWLLNGSLDQFRLEEERFRRTGDNVRLTVWPGANHISIVSDTSRLATFVRDAWTVARA